MSLQLCNCSLPLMASSFHSKLSPLSITQPIKTTATTRTFVPIRCGPRNNRGPLVKGRVLSTEAIQAVQSLKRAHNDQSKLTNLVSKTLPRLIKSDLIAAFNELLRQDHCDLALLVFSAVKSEPSYKTDLGIYADLVSAMTRKGLTAEIDCLVGELEREGVIQCADKGLVRLVKALIAAERAELTVRIYGLMKRSGWSCDSSASDEYVAKVLSKGLRRLGEESLADEIDVELAKLFRGVVDKVRV